MTGAPVTMHLTSIPRLPRRPAEHKGCEQVMLHRRTWTALRLRRQTEDRYERGQPIVLIQRRRPCGPALPAACGAERAGLNSQVNSKTPSAKGVIVLQALPGRHGRSVLDLMGRRHDRSAGHDEPTNKWQCAGVQSPAGGRQLVTC
jgi:hypothetical protein